MKKRIKIGAWVTVLLIVALMAGCSGGAGGSGGNGDMPDGTDNSGGSADTLTGATDGILSQVIDAAGATLTGNDALPGLLTDPITIDNAPGMLGLIPDDFTEYVTEATVAQGAINTFAFQVALVKCNDAESAQTVNEQIKTGFDSGKWICVFPEQSLTVVSGSYVLLAVGTKAQTDALASAFASAAGSSASAPEIFYTGETGGGDLGGGADIGGGGGMGITIN